MKILVSGAGGMLAETLKKTLPKDKGFDVAFLKKNAWDISDAVQSRAIIQEIKPDVIINTAAFTKVDDAESNLMHAAKINHLALKNLAVEANTVGARILHVSTDYVFDGYKTDPYDEDDPCFPLNNYGLTKRLGELAIMANSNDFLILRTSWLYTSIGNNFFRTILRLAKEKAEISIISDQVSSPTYAIDLAEAIWKVILPVNKNVIGIFHYSNTGEASWFRFAKEIVDLSGHTCVVKPIPSTEYPQAATRPFYSKLNTQKISKQFKLTIPTWQSGVKRCWDSSKNL